MPNDIATPTLSRDGYPMVRAHLPAKNYRSIVGKRRLDGQRVVKVVRYDGDNAHVLVRRGRRWQNEVISRKLIVQGN